MMQKIFSDRREAGRLLASEVAKRGYRDAVVLGLPRGGLPVAAEVAAALGAPLDIMLVRKIGAPFQPELAMGAIVDGDEPEVVRNENVISEFGVTESAFQRAAEEQLKIIDARRALWVVGRAQVPIKGKTVIVVDDGIATGATILASLHALKRRGAGRIVVATPVSPPEVVAMLEDEADEAIVLEVPRYMGAIGFFYVDFSQVSDAEVSDILERASQRGVHRQQAG